jgi:radical SAM superfamily enzyme YgiQ (UPF0313 family)
MKIGLIFPRFKYPSGDPPLGLMYVAAYLRQEVGCSVDILDSTFFKNTETFCRYISEKEPYDLVGISLMTFMMYDAFDVARYIKTYYPRTKIIMGGPHPTVMPEQTMENRNIDAVCTGEGEWVMADVVRSDRNFQDVNGVWYRDGDQVVHNPDQESIQDLDKLPFPAWDLVPMETYFDHWFLMDSVQPGLRGTSLCASRGCPFKCTYCQPTLNAIFGKKIRKRSPANIVDEIEALKDRYRITAFAFQDDTFIIDKKWARSVAQEMIDRKVNLVWETNVRADLIPEDLLQTLYEAGLRKINIGIESHSQKTLDEIYDKKITVEQVEESVRIANKIGIKVQGYFMLGAPTEGIKDALDTIKFARNLDIHDATFSITTPLPMTYLYDKTKELIEKDLGEFDYYSTSVYKNSVTASSLALKMLKKWAFFSFYLTPKRMFKTLKLVLDPSQITKTLVKLKRVLS